MLDYAKVSLAKPKPNHPKSHYPTRSGNPFDGVEWRIDLTWITVTSTMMTVGTV